MEPVDAAPVLSVRDLSVAFGGIRGFNRFHPQDIEPDRTPPPVLLTELRGLHAIKAVRVDERLTERDLRRTLTFQEGGILRAADLMVVRMTYPHSQFDPDGNVSEYQRGTNELPMRNQYRSWARYMTETM